jgi:DNA-binding transcriptional LysR family regulator
VESDSQITKALNRVDLNLLVVLDVLLRERNVTATATFLSLSQPAVSGSLKKLRRLFGDELLVRDGRSMRRTSFGDALVIPVQATITQIEHVLWTRPTFDPAADRRRFNILASDYSLVVLLRPFVRALREEAPNVSLAIETLLPDDYLNPLTKAVADFAVLPDFMVERCQGIESQTLFEDRYVGVTWAENDHVSERMTLDEFRGHPFLAFEEHGAQTLIERVLEEHGLALEPSLALGSFTAGAFCLAETNLVATLQERLARELLEPARLKTFDLETPAHVLTVVLAWHCRKNDDVAHTWLRQRLTEFARGL